MSNIPNAPSTLANTIYVEPSATLSLTPGTKIGDLFRRNIEDPYVLQRLTERSWWVSIGNYATVFYVGEDSVLLLDAMEGMFEPMTAAIASVTDKPISAIVYSHYHADHIGDIQRYAAAAAAAGRTLRIVASEKTAAKLEAAGSMFPRPTETVSWPNGSCTFEDLRVELHGFVWAAHTEDHSAWLLVGERVIHSPDLINPDQPPFWRFGGSERFLFSKENLTAVRELDWDFLSGGHGNIGSRDDIDFDLAFYADLQDACLKAMAVIPFTDFVNPADGAHTGWLAGFVAAIGKAATDSLRPKYGQLYGYEAATRPNAEMMAMTLSEYR